MNIFEGIILLGILCGGAWLAAWIGRTFEISLLISIPVAIAVIVGALWVLALVVRHFEHRRIRK